MSAGNAPRRIVVTTDLSKSSQVAFTTAASLATRFSAHLSLVHVTREGKRSEDLRQLTQSHPAFEKTDVAPRILKGGSAASAIAQFAQEESVDLVVMATHGHSALARFLLGSVTEKVLRAAPCSVLLVRPSPSGRAVMSFRRTLVAYDLSDRGRAALEVGAEWSGSMDSELRLVSVVPDRLLIYHYSDGPRKFRDMLSELQVEAETALKDAVQRLAPVTASTCVRRGQVVSEILTEARDWSADLLVLGAHGASDSGEFFLGRVAEKVGRNAPCSTLVVRDVATGS